MRGIAHSVMILTFFIAVGNAWAEPARGSRQDRAESARMLRAEERSRAITWQICRGCGVERHAHQRRRAPKVALRRGRFRVPVTTAWTPIPALPLTGKPESQVRDINQQMAWRQQMLRFEQQTQFEINQLRTEIGRDYLFR
jgi:hypothetical protein